MILTTSKLKYLDITLKKDENSDRHLYDNEGKEITHLVLPNYITEIDSCCFIDCINLEKVTLPESLRCIHQFAFRSCKKLKEINIPENLESIHNKAFMHTKIKNLTFSENFKCAGGGAFSFMDKLEEITFKNKDTYIGRGAFAFDTKLKNINLPKNLKIVEEDTFLNCLLLDKINLESVEEIAHHAFVNNMNLKEITLSKNLIKIDKDFLDFNAKMLSKKTKQKDFLTDICGFMQEDIYEIIKGNQYINIKSIPLDFLIDTGKSFKEINNTFKNLER